MKTTIHDIARRIAYALANDPALQRILSDLGGEARVFLDAIGTEVVEAPDYPYVVVSPARDEEDAGTRSRSVSIVLAARVDGDGDASKAVPIDQAGRVWAFGRGDALVAARDRIADILRALSPGSRLSSLETDFDFNTYPVQSISISATFEDHFAY